jgi:hypothetical protein
MEKPKLTTTDLFRRIGLSILTGDATEAKAAAADVREAVAGELEKQKAAAELAAAQGGDDRAVVVETTGEASP